MVINKTDSFPIFVVLHIQSLVIIYCCAWWWEGVLILHILFRKNLRCVYFFVIFLQWYLLNFRVWSLNFSKIHIMVIFFCIDWLTYISISFQCESCLTFPEKKKNVCVFFRVDMLTFSCWVWKEPRWKIYVWLLVLTLPKRVQQGPKFH